MRLTLLAARRYLALGWLACGGVCFACDIPFRLPQGHDLTSLHFSIGMAGYLQMDSLSFHLV